MEDYYWLDDALNIADILNSNKTLKISWTKNKSVDTFNISKNFFSSAYIVANEITTGSRSNIKTDTWFFPEMFLFRQSIELVIKAGLCELIKYNPTLQEIFCKYKHNVIALFNEYIRHQSCKHIPEKEKKWLIDFLNDIEKHDSKSDLFRYPFDDDFLKQYQNKSIDIVYTSNNLIKCYSLLAYYFFEEETCKEDCLISNTPRFLTFTDDDIWNCYLWESLTDNGYFKQINGYKEVGDFLYSLIDNGSKEYFFPMLFVLRNCIELSLKNLLFTRNEIRVEEYKRNRIRKSHLLHKELWKNIKPILDHYGNDNPSEANTLNLAEQYVKSISDLDKNGDIFRYPYTKSFEYKLINKEFDIDTIYKYFMGVINFLGGCDAMLDHIADIENEMRAEYESYYNDYY